MSIIFSKVFPIGCIFISISSTNPEEMFGGVWVAWGTGRVPVGIDTTDSNFSTVEKEGGSSTHTLSTNEIPAHTHGAVSISGTIMTLSYTGSRDTGISTISSSTYNLAKTSSGSNMGSVTHTISSSHTHTSVGGGAAHNNLQPYITCYMWKRIE